MPGLTREQKVLFQMLKGQTIDSLDSVNAGELIELLRRHRLFPISEGLLRLLKDPERNDLKQRIQHWALKSLHLSSVLNEIFNEFTKKGIDAISLKGPILTHALFGDMSKRSFGDLDILVKREVMWESIDVLKGLGFQLQYPNENLTPKQWEHYFSYKKEVGLVHKTQKSYIELHIGIYTHELLRKSEESVLLDDSVEEIIYDTPIMTLNQESTFLYLVYHGANHLYSRLFWLRDVAEALKIWDLDHESILSKAKQLGIDRLLGVSLLLSKDFCGSEIPDEYAYFLKSNPTKLNQLTRLCHKRIQGNEKETIISRLRKNHYFILLKPGLKYRWTVFESLFHRWYIRKFLGGH
jgi:hypothetical protein